MRRLVRSPRLALLWIVLLSFGSMASAAPAKKEKPASPSASSPKLEDPKDIGALKYRSLGPAWGGRVARVAGTPGDDRVFYAATAGGGVWKSVDAGASWKPIFDDQPISSIGSIAVSYSDPNVIYVGSGEANIRGNVAAGNGIYKSTDAGKTWTQVWKQEGQIGTMAVDPTNPDVAFAAVLGHAFGPNPERGVYRTRDGGKTWQQVLKKDADTGASDVAIDPSNPRTVFAGLWQARRLPWVMTSGGPGSGLYVSHDDGDTWKQLTGKGLPDGIWGKVGIAVAPSDGRRVYALIEAEKGGLFSSDDGGETWTLASGDRKLRQRAWYYSTMAVNPINREEVWFPQVPMLKSIDGGKTLKIFQLSHGDQHDVWFDPKNPRRIIIASDGGVDITLDGGETWTAPALPLGQFYHVSVDSSAPFRIAGAMQDIGTAQGPSNTLRNSGPANSDWYGVGGGEAGWVVSDPSDPDILYAGEYLGYISRYNNRTHQSRAISAWPDNPSGFGAEQMRYRFQWTAPIAASPHDPKVVYHGANVLFRTADGGQSWTPISPDLTRNDKSKQQWSGGPITGDNTGVETYDTIFVIAESPLEKGLIWIGTDDGLVQLTRDGGKNWQNVTAAVPGLPEWGTVRMIEPSRFDAGTAFLVVDAHRLDDTHPYLWKTADYGHTWKRLDGGLPRDVYLHSVREDPAKRGMLYLGTERGVAFSRDDGATWQSLKLNLPTVAVHDLVVKDNSLVLATMGRSIWIFDDLAALRDFTPEVTAADFKLLPVPDSIRWSIGGGSRLTGWSGDNPPQGASIYYWLKKEPKDDVVVEILDASGTVVDRLTSKPMEPTGSSEYVEDESEQLKRLTVPKAAGLQRAVWGYNWAGAEMIQGAILDSGYPLIGPKALPGTYTVRLTVDGKTQTMPMRVLPDPRVQASEADQAEQLRFALEVRDAITRLTHTTEQLRSVRRQIATRNDLLAKDPKAAPMIQASNDFLTKMDAVEAKLHNPKAQVSYDVLAMKGGAALYSRFSPLFDSVKDGIGAPTQGMREVFAARKAELDQFTGEWQALRDHDLAALNDQAKSLGLPAVYVSESR